MDFGFTFLPFYKLSSFFWFPLCGWCPHGMASHQGILAWVRPGPRLSETKCSDSCPRGKRVLLEARLLGDHAACFCWPSPTWTGPQQALLWRSSHHQSWVERDPSRVSLEQTPSAVSLSLLAVPQVPKKMEDPGARSGPVFPGAVPQGKREENKVPCSPLSVSDYD